MSVEEPPGQPAPGSRPVLRDIEVTLNQRFLLALWLLSLVTACAAPAAQGPSPTGAQVEKAPDLPPHYVVRCEIVRPTGSNIAEEQCRTIYQSEADRRAAQEYLGHPTTTAPRAGAP
jgi:hypothetical protein